MWAASPYCLLSILDSSAFSESAQRFGLRDSQGGRGRGSLARRTRPVDAQSGSAHQLVTRSCQPRARRTHGVRVGRALTTPHGRHVQFIPRTSAGARLAPTVPAAGSVLAVRSGEARPARSQRSRAWWAPSSGRPRRSGQPGRRHSRRARGVQLYRHVALWHFRLRGRCPRHVSASRNSGDVLVWSPIYPRFVGIRRNRPPLGRRDTRGDRRQRQRRSQDLRRVGDHTREPLTPLLVCA